MNELAISTNTHFHNAINIMERNREKYPNAYFTYKGGQPIFDLGMYIVNYCCDVSLGYTIDDWEESFVTSQTALIPMWIDEKYEAHGFFSLPPRVQEGILICIQENFYNASTEDAMYQVSSDLYFSSREILEARLKYTDEYLERDTDEEKKAFLEDEIFSWEEYQCYNQGYPLNGPGEGFFQTEDSIIFASQLAAYMGYSAQLDSTSFNETGFSTADALLEGMAAWEGLKKVEFQGEEASKYNECTDTVILVNSSQGILTGNTDLADYMEKAFNRSPWQHDLKNLMEQYNEYFPLKDSEIRIDAYARMEE